MPKLTFPYQNIIDALALFSIVIARKNEALTREITSTGKLTNDSRSVQQGDIFCAVVGHAQNGRLYIRQAIQAGAALVIAECKTEQAHGNTTIENGVTIIEFYQLNQQLFSLAKAYYQNPQAKMTMIGITGTNGKTSTSQLIANIFTSCQQPCAVIGTNGAGRIDNLQPLVNTTPSATELHKLFAEFVEQNIELVAMEASSHALVQGRVTADLFDIAVYTNLSRDHLDYHQTMDAYAAAKKQMFTGDNKQIAVLNGDDKQAQQWLSSWPTQQIVWVYGRGESFIKQKMAKQYKNYVCASHVKHHSQGVSFTLKTHIGDIEINSPLLGDFNIDNLLAAMSVLLIKDISLTEIASSVAKLTPIMGRMESTSLPGFATAVVDYAHTPDALENALIACREHCHGKLWVVFGCGGDRDKGKRPLMAQAAENFADKLVITNDNPRSENPEAIAEDVLAGCKHPEKVTTILDREQAVLATLTKAHADDIVLLAGKGHEDYIILGNKKVAYNEREIVKEFFLKNKGVQA